MSRRPSIVSTKKPAIRPSPSPSRAQLPVGITTVIHGAEGPRELPEERVVVTRADWRKRVNAMREVFDRVYGPGTCVIRLVPIPEDRRSSEEHVILDGTGIGWIKLPRGFVDDSVNNGASSAEGAFLGRGLMGALRPFFKLGENFWAGDGLVLERKADGSLHLGTAEVPRFREIPEGIEFDVEAEIEYPASMAVSHAIHKMGYLTFATLLPNLAVHPCFDAVRNYITSPAEALFRPYTEHFGPGRAPGASLRFFIEVEEAASTWTPMRIACDLTIHHLNHSFLLFGSEWEDTPGENRWTFLAPTPAKTRKLAITWQGRSVQEVELPPS